MIAAGVETQAAKVQRIAVTVVAVAVAVGSSAKLRQVERLNEIGSGTLQWTRSMDM